MNQSCSHELVLLDDDEAMPDWNLLWQHVMKRSVDACEHAAIGSLSEMRAAMLESESKSPKKARAAGTESKDELLGNGLQSDGKPSSKGCNPLLVVSDEASDSDDSEVRVSKRSEPDAPVHQ